MSKEMWFGAGFLAGSLAAGVAVYIYLKDRFQKELEAKIETINESYKELFNKQEERLNEAEEELNRGISTVIERAVNEATGKNQAHNYNAYASTVKLDPSMMVDKSSIKEPEENIMGAQYPAEEDEVLTDEDQRYLAGLEMSTDHEIHKNDDPVIIKKDEFGELENYDKIECVYYVENDVLVDDEAEEELDEAIYVGTCMLEFKADDDVDDIWIRNFKIMKDFHIQKAFTSYNPGVF